MLRVLKKVAHYIIDIVSYALFVLCFNNKRRRVIEAIRNKQYVKIAFVVGNLPMWKSQAIVDRLSSFSKVEVKIFLSPNIKCPIEQQKSDIEILRDYFQSIQQDYVDYLFEGRNCNLRDEFNPDIIFYQQPYENITYIGHDYTLFKDRLIAYIPYSFWPGAEPYGFDLPFHRFCWRIYYANSLIFNYAKSVSLIGARNSVIVGYPSTDFFLKSSYKDVWRNSDKNFKRVIWAPHFTIEPRAWNVHSSFLNIAESMLSLAEDTQDRLQIAFKPHPKLKSVLYTVWGKERTDSYYQKWESMSNTQLETGSYVDLFMTSDCLIHDCGSFLVEYQYAMKPSMYILENYEAVRPTLNELGKVAFDLHYKGRNIDDIVNFLNNVVIDGVDKKAEERIEFFNLQLMPPNSKTVAENICESIYIDVGLVD